MKLVKESISFQRGIDPKETLGIGQKYLIEKWLEEMKIKDYIIRDDMTIDVGAVELRDKGIVMLPEYIKFNRVGEFQIRRNKLISLRGSPEYVETFFVCDNNQLTSLKYSPKECGYFSCTGNLLTSLEGCPKIVHNDFWCEDNSKQFTIQEVLQYCKVSKKDITVKSQF